MQERLEAIVKEHAELERRLAELATEPEAFAKLNRKYKELSPLAEVALRLLEAKNNLAQAKVLLTDPEFKELAQEEIEKYEALLPELTAQFEELSIAKDPADDRNAIIEIRAGTGGAEAGLFAGDLYQLYSRYALKLGFKVETLDSNESEIGGFSSISFEIKGGGAYGEFKYESGVHRVQRVPTTESQGRVHTSTATVAVLLEAEDVDVDFDMSDIRVDVYRAGGHGGQGVNTTDSAVRVTYKAGTPEMIVVTCQDSRSQLQNKDKALLILRSRLFERKRQETEQRERQLRLSQIGTGERSEKIRTYNFPQNRITDHRLEGDEKNFSLQQVMEGELGPITRALKLLERKEKLESHG